MAKDTKGKKNWISNAIKPSPKGKLSKDLGIPSGKKIIEKPLRKGKKD